MIVWFGVMPGVNMQTSFMHPRWLRAVLPALAAPRSPYIDKITGKTMELVKTTQIYWGAVPRDHPADHGHAGDDDACSWSRNGEKPKLADQKKALEQLNNIPRSRSLARPRRPAEF